MNRFRVLSTVIVLLISFAFGLVSFIHVMNQPSDAAPTIEDISEYLTNSAKIKEISLPKRGTQSITAPEVSYNFEGYVFRVLASDMAKGRIGNSDIISDDLYTDVLNATAYARNTYVADSLNIEIREIVAEDAGADLKKSILSYDDNYDMLSLETSSEMYMQLQAGALVDLHTIKTLNLDNPWYDSSCVRDLAIADKLFMLTGDIVTGNDDAVYAMVYNRDLAEQLGYYSDDTYSFVKMAEEGRWTLDALHIITDQINSSIESDSASYGSFYNRGLDTFALSVGSGASSFYTDSVGIPNINLNSEQFKQIFNKVVNLQTFPAGNSEISADGFIRGKALFDTVMLGDLLKLNEHEINYGILPIPKYDESQSDYRSLVNLAEAVSIAVPVTQENLDRSGIIIEELSSESSWYMWQNYYDGITKNDENSAKMMKTILSNKVYDLGDLFGWINVSQALSKLTETNGISSFHSQMDDRSSAAQFVMNIILKNIEDPE